MKCICYCGLRLVRSIRSPAIHIKFHYVLIIHWKCIKSTPNIRRKVIGIMLNRSSSTIISDASDSIVISMRRNSGKKFQSPESHTSRFYWNYRLRVFIFVQQNSRRKKSNDERHENRNTEKKTNQRETLEFIWSLLLLLLLLIIMQLRCRVAVVVVIVHALHRANDAHANQIK